MFDEGYIVILVLLVLTVLLSTGIFLLDHFLLQQKIVHNLYMEFKTYYLAQGGVEYAAARLSQNPVWRTTGMTLNLNADGVIHLTVLTEDSMVHVQSNGMVQPFEKKEDAYFTKFPPIHRTK